MTGQSNPQNRANIPSHDRSTNSRTKFGSLSPSRGSGSNDVENDDENDNPNNPTILQNNRNETSSSDSSIPTSTIGVSSFLLPSVGGLIRLTLGATVALYILNQNHLLPQPVSKIVSHVLFWPTLPITISKRLGKWYTPIDDTVIVGGAPFGFAKIPELLYEQYGVRHSWYESCISKVLNMVVLRSLSHLYQLLFAVSFNINRFVV